MKRSFSLVAFSALLFLGFTWQKVPASNVVIGNYKYDITLVKGYDHDDDSYSTYFVVSLAKSHKELCSATLSTIRGNTVLTAGEYRVEGSQLLFKERYFGPKQIRGFVFADSIQKTFHPDRTGKLHLTEIRQYKAGKVTNIRY